MGNQAQIGLLKVMEKDLINFIIAASAVITAWWIFGRRTR